MDLVAIVSLVNQLAQGAISIGMNFSQLAALQAQAEAQGRELTVEDIKKIRDDSRAALDRLDTAIKQAEENPG